MKFRVKVTEISTYIVEAPSKEEARDKVDYAIDMEETDNLDLESGGFGMKVTRWRKYPGTPAV